MIQKKQKQSFLAIQMQVTSVATAKRGTEFTASPSSIPSNQAPAVSPTRHPLWTLAMLFITALQTCAVSCIPASPLPLSIASHRIN